MRFYPNLVRRIVRHKRTMLVVTGGLLLTTVASAIVIPNLIPFFDPTRLVSPDNTNGPIDENSPFFESLGTNGRSCSTCHVLGNAMGLSTQNIQERFLLTTGRDPLFAAVDGANCPNTSSNDPATHSLMLENGLVRIPLQLPDVWRVMARCASPWERSNR